MATSATDQANLELPLARGGRPPQHSLPRRRTGRVLLGLLLLGLLAAGGAYVLPQLAEMTTRPSQTGVLTYTVARNNVLVTLTEDGNLESASNIDVKCAVAGGGTILWIAEEGKYVEEGEVLVRLDTANIEEQLSSQKIAVEKALATKIQAQETYAAAAIAVREYEQSVFVQALKTVEAEIRVAEENLRSARNILEYTDRMVRKGFATALQREADQFAVERAQLDLEAALTRKTGLVEFTKPKMLKELEAAREAAAAQARSDEAAYELEVARLERLKLQLANCVITAPQRGMVIYANDASRRRSSGSSDVQIQEGAVVRDGQAIIRLPDLSRMQVRVAVHESRVDQLKPGMPARIVVQEKEYRGKVLSVANQPEPGSWFSANVKEYATTVSIDDQTNGLRPGQTAHVEILIADLRDVLTVPVSAVVSQRSGYHCWVQTPAGYERRELQLGQTNDKLVEVIDGVKEGDEVLRNPRAVVPDARKDAPGGDDLHEDSRFEDAAPGAPPSDGGSSPSTSGRFPPGAVGRPVGAAGGEGGPSAGPRPVAGGNFNLMQFDADGDGRISRAEAPERMQAGFDRIDADGDGYLSAAEIRELRMRQGGSGGDGTRASSGPGGGAP